MQQISRNICVLFSKQYEEVKITESHTDDYGLHFSSETGNRYNCMLLHQAKGFQARTRYRQSFNLKFHC